MEIKTGKSKPTKRYVYLKGHGKRYEIDEKGYDSIGRALMIVVEEQILALALK